MKIVIAAVTALGLSCAVASAGEMVPGHWEGFYAGVHVGAASSPFYDYVYDGGYSGTATGLLAGGQVGFNTRLSGNVIVGLEGSASWDGMRGPGDEWDVTFSQAWEASLRARVAYDLGKYLPYIAAGIAVTDAKADYGGVDEYTVSGPTTGAGLAMALGERTSGFVEVSHADFGKRVWGYDAHLTENAIRIGVNVRLGH